jgi:hypothetical protein
MVSAEPFVGRERELAYLRRELSAGRCVVVTGPFGIGRTSLLRHAAVEMAREWTFVFADFEGSPGDAWRELYAAIFPRAWKRLRGERMSARWTRFRVLNQRPESRRPAVVVLDNVARLPASRLDFARRLREKFLVVAIVEDFVPEPAKAALCAALWARPPLRLPHLSVEETAAYFASCSLHHGFGWGPGEILGLARAVAGFPLGMREAMEAERRRREPRSRGRAAVARSL